jgi:hypothetical protein
MVSRTCHKKYKMVLDNGYNQHQRNRNFVRDHSMITHVQFGFNKVIYFQGNNFKTGPYVKLKVKYWSGYPFHRNKCIFLGTTIVI